MWDTLYGTDKPDLISLYCHMYFQQKYKWELSSLEAFIMSVSSYICAPLVTLWVGEV